MSSACSRLFFNLHAGVNYSRFETPSLKSSSHPHPQSLSISTRIPPAGRLKGLSFGYVLYADCPRFRGLLHSISSSLFLPHGILCLAALNNSAYLGYEHKTRFLAPHLSLSYQFVRLQKHLKFPIDWTRGGLKINKAKSPKKQDQKASDVCFEDV